MVFETAYVQHESTTAPLWVPDQLPVELSGRFLSLSHKAILSGLPQVQNINTWLDNKKKSNSIFKNGQKT